MYDRCSIYLKSDLMRGKRVVSIVIHSVAAAILLLLFLNGVASYTISRDIEHLLGHATASRWSCSIRGVWVNPLSMQGRLADIKLSSGSAVTIDKQGAIDSVFIEIGQLAIDDIRDLRVGDEINISRAKISGGSIKIWRAEEASEPLYLALLIENLRSREAIGSLRVDSMALDIGLTHLSISGVRIDTAKALLTAKELVVKPTFPTDVIFREGARYSSWSTFYLDGISASGLAYRELLSKGDISIRSIKIDSSAIISYKSRRALEPATVKPLIYQSLHSLSRALCIDSIHLRTMDASYFEIPTRGDSIGAVSFESISALATKINNRAPFGSTFTIMAEALVEGQGRAELEFRLPNARGDDRFAISGKVGAMSLKRFNTMLLPLLGVSLSSGELDSLSFGTVGTSRSSWSRAPCSTTTFHSQWPPTRGEHTTLVHCSPLLAILLSKRATHSTER